MFQQACEVEIATGLTVRRTGSNSNPEAPAVKPDAEEDGGN